MFLLITLLPSTHIESSVGLKNRALAWKDDRMHGWLLLAGCEIIQFVLANEVLLRYSGLLVG